MCVCIYVYIYKYMVLSYIIHILYNKKWVCVCVCILHKRFWDESMGSIYGRDQSEERKGETCNYILIYRKVQQR